MRTRLVWLVPAFAVLASPAAAPPPPAATVPDPRQTNASPFCVECDQPFDTPTHKKLLEGLLKNPYAVELRKALYMQDIAHQIESKAHFDNCDFDGAMKYLDVLLSDVAAKAKLAKEAKARGDATGMKTQVAAAYFALGQALHSVQDFYAHTNYVELMAPGAKRAIDIPLMSLWTAQGKLRLSDRLAKGLVSGVVSWGFPKQCKDGTPSHGELAKDSESTPSGGRRLPHLENNSQYQIAVFLAREDSLELMRYAFKQWPILQEVAGPNILLDVLVDRRM